MTTNVFCRAKWSDSSIYVYDGSVASCCMHKSTHVPIEDFNNFHNIKKNIQDRQDMLDGIWPKQCFELCGKYEDSKGEGSRRSFFNNILGLMPKELGTTGMETATTVTPTNVEVFFNNTCNLACLYCRPQDSSKIEAENRKFGPFEIKGIFRDEDDAKIPNGTEYVEAFFNWLELNYKDLRRLSIIGGEPLYQKDFDRVLEFFKHNPAPDLILSITSNLMVKEDRLAEYITTWRDLLKDHNLKRFDVNASIDCWGDEQEFARTGLDLELFEKNFETLLHTKWLRLSINQAITCLGIRTMPDLIKKINEWQKVRAFGHTAACRNDPTYMNPNVFGTLFSEDWKTVLDLIGDHTFDERSIKKQINGFYQESLSATVNEAEVTKFKIYMDEMDKRRNTNWRNTFNYLDI